MLRAAIIFFLLGLLSFLFSLYGIAGVTPFAGKLFIVMFSVFALISFVGAMSTGKEG